MSELRVERGTVVKLGKVEGELRVASNAKITAASGRKVTVTQGAYFEGNAEIDCDFECDTLVVDRGRLIVHGDLTVHKRLDVAHTVEANGLIRAKDIDVGGKVRAKSISCEGSIRVGGVIDVEDTLEAKSVEVGGKAAVAGKVDIVDFGVGGKADVGGGRITGHTQVGGFFSSTRPLEFGELLVYGRCKLHAGSSGKKISAFGALSIDGDFAAEEALVNGKLDVAGSLQVKGTLETNGSCEVRGELAGNDLRVGGRFQARKAILSNQVDIAGEVATTVGLKAKSISIRSGTRCMGVLVGDRVELGRSWGVAVNWGKQWLGQSIVARGIAKMTSAEDIYGSEVILGPNSRCGKIFAKTVELGEGCVVDRVTYTEELRRGGAGGRVFITTPPEKVTELPSFPL